MNRTSLLAVASIAALAGSLAIASPLQNSQPAKKPATAPATQPATPTKPAAQPGEHALPPGMSAEDMQACMEAGTPGEQHQHLAKAAGTWAGTTRMWMTPGSEPMVSECVTTITPVMDGRFVKSETSGDMPGMGAFLGFGINGFDNVSQKFQSTWVDNMGTGMMVGTGVLSSDGKTMTWTYNYTCPITKKAAVMREVETRTGADSMTLEMFGAEPRTGKEFKMMEITYKRTGAAPSKPATPSTTNKPAKH